ncbi:hypothetical protein PSY40_23185 [Shigella flexneri]|nr:hypothetical protein [Shigella flexneri]
MSLVDIAILILKLIVAVLQQ